MKIMNDIKNFDLNENYELNFYNIFSFAISFIKNETSSKSIRNEFEIRKIYKKITNSSFNKESS